MKKVIAITFALLAVSFNAQAQDNAGLTLLTSSKFIGMCETLNHQVKYQKEINELLPSGGEFLVRFWKTETTRLGFDDIDSFVAQCSKSRPMVNEAFGNKEVEDTMHTAFIAGICGVLGQQVDFQIATEMDAGTEFIANYWKIVALHHGAKDVDGFASDCVGKGEQYLTMRTLLTK